MVRLMDVDALVEQLERDMKETGRSAFRPYEVPGLVRAAVEKLSKEDRGHRFPIGEPMGKRPPVFRTNAIAGEAPRRGVRTPTGDRAIDKMSGADRSDLSA